MRHRVDRSNLKSHLRNTLLAMLDSDASGRNMWPSKERIAITAGISKDGVRHHLHALVRQGVLTMVRPSGTWVPKPGGGAVFRYPTTYRLNASKLKPRPTIKQYFANRAAENVAKSK